MLTLFFFFFFNDTATTEIYTLSLHDALPIYSSAVAVGFALLVGASQTRMNAGQQTGDAVRIDNDDLGGVVTSTKGDRKSTRLNSSHGYISYAVFCLKKKNQ